MSRFAPILVVCLLLAFPAEAANLVHPSATVKATEKGVAVWRGPIKKAAPDTAGSSLAGNQRAARCELSLALLQPAGWAPRRLVTHGFWSGEPFSAPYGVATTGFFADRMAAGL